MRPAWFPSWAWSMKAHCKKSLASFRFMTLGHCYTVDEMPDDWKHGQTLRSLARKFSILLMMADHFFLGKVAANVLAFSNQWVKPNGQNSLLEIGKCGGSPPWQK